MWGKIFVIVAFCFASVFPAEIFIQSPRVSDWGDWGEYVECPPGMYVIGLQVVAESDQGVFGDDSAMGGVFLFCYSTKLLMNALDFFSGYGSPRKYVMVSSTIGHDGYVRSAFECPFPEYAIGFELRSDPYHGGFYDDTAANNMRLRCTKGSFVEADGEVWGDWTGVQNCPRGFRICGIKTQVEKPGSGDETTLNNVELGCCQIPT